jgi:hypothetical protein
MSETDDAHVQAHRHSSLHREEVLASDVCGCFYCLQAFSPGEIEEWVDEAHGTDVGRTAICPRCGIDSVIGSASGVPITHEMLLRMNLHWF